MFNINISKQLKNRTKKISKNFKNTANVKHPFQVFFLKRSNYQIPYIYQEALRVQILEITFVIFV